MTKVTPNMKPKEGDISFEVPEFELYDRGLGWYAAVLVGFAVLIVFSFSLHDVRLGIIIMLSTVLFYQLALAHPQNTQLILNNHGVTFRNKFYPWNLFHSFSLFGNEKHMTIHLERLAFLRGPLVIPVPSQSHMIVLDKKDEPSRDVIIVSLRSVLAERLHGHISPSDWLGRLLRF